MRRRGVLLGPVGAPAAHEVQHLGVLRYQLLEEPANGHDGSVVDMYDQAGHGDRTRRRWYRPHAGRTPAGSAAGPLTKPNLLMSAAWPVGVWKRIVS